MYFIQGDVGSAATFSKGPSSTPISLASWTILFSWEHRTSVGADPGSTLWDGQWMPVLLLLPSKPLP